MTLPEGWTIKKKEPTDLPPGWTIKKKAPPSTPQSRDDEKLKQLAGGTLVEKKTPEEFKNMSVWERMEYADDINRQGQMISGKLFIPSVLSGATFGATENIPGLEVPQFEENPYSIFTAAGKATGSLVPLSGLTKVFTGPAVKLASKSPILQKQLSSLATMFGVGATDKALHQVAKGEMPSSEDMLEHGLEWAALDVVLQSLGKAGSFAKGLLSRSESTGVSRLNILKDIVKDIKESGIDLSELGNDSAKNLISTQKVAEIAMKRVGPGVAADSEATARELFLPERFSQTEKKVSQATEDLGKKTISSSDLKNKAIGDEGINKLKDRAHELSDPDTPTGINFAEDAEYLADTQLRRKIDSTGEKAASEQELGNALKKDVEQNLEARRAEYRPLYAQVEEAAQNIMHKPSQVGEQATQKLRDLKKISTSPAGYKETIKNLQDVLKDSGYHVQFTPEGQVELVLSAGEVPVSNTIELARRLNEMVNYEAVEPTVKEVLRSVARAAKRDIRTALAENPDALAAFELAEEAHALTASKFSTDSMVRLRGQTAGEKISKMAESPSMMGELKETLSPEAYAQLERQALERLQGKTYKEAIKDLEKIKKHLSEENRSLAKEIIESKNPNNPSARKALARESVLEEMAQAVGTGERPTKTLRMWNSKKGRKVVEEAFEGSPNWEPVKDYLEKQSLSDMVGAITSKGRLDAKKLREFMDNPALVESIQAQGGDEAVYFFQQLNTRTNNLKESGRMLHNKIFRPPHKKAGASDRGSEILQKAKAKAEKPKKISELAEDKIVKDLPLRAKPKAEGAEPTNIQGRRILDRMMKKDFPAIHRIKTWKEWFAESMGLKDKAVMQVFSLMRFGIPHAITSLVIKRLLNRAVVNPKIRKLFYKASRRYVNPIPFLTALDELTGELD